MPVKSSDASIKALKSRRKEYETAIVGHRGLVVVVYPSGARSYTYRFRQDGVLKRVFLEADSLAAARTEWAALTGTVKKGADPAEVVRRGKAAKQLKRKADRADPTITDLAADFIRLHSKKKKRSWRADELMLEGLVLPEWGSLKAKDVERRDVVALLDKVAETAPIRANRLLAVVRKMFNWAVQRDVLPASPCAGVKAPANETARDRTLTDGELRLFWNGLPKSNIPADTQTALRLQLLTGCRIGEIAGARWSELDRQKGEWLIPGARTKNRRECLLPLPQVALALLEGLDDAGPYLFPRKGKKSGHLRADVATHELGHGEFAIAERFTSHDLRRTMATNLGRLRVPRVVQDAILNHKDRSIGATYDRHDYYDEKRAALGAWAAHLHLIVRGEECGKVVPIRSASSG
ncbi:tyrosine-type recombinase/integrase [Panacagrimonas sp.]|uniref:tyrosine-type recombinase/integrase n=1 Tax=Panacagrimonas sp. TaxID=2480088 RepID=UPI003B520588